MKGVVLSLAPDAVLVDISHAIARHDVVAGEVIVKLKDNASLDAVSARHGLGKGRSGYGKSYEILLTGKGNERAMAARGGAGRPHPIAPE